MVAVEDAGGNVTTINVGSVSLAIQANPGNGTLSGCSKSTSGGVATYSGCSINQVGQGYTLVATDGTLQSTTTNPFNVVTPVLSSFGVVPSTNNPTAGTPFTVTVTGLDQSGYTYPGLTGTQTIAFSGPSNAPNGQAPAYPASVSFTNGVGTASVTLYDAQSTTLTATQGTVTGTSSTLTVGPKSTATALSLATPGTQVAGTQFNEAITAVDTYGNTVTAFSGTKTVSFSGPANSPSGKAPTYPGSVTFSSGVGTASIKLYDAQTTTLTATQSTLTGTSGSFSVTAGSAAQFSLSTPSTQTAGTAFIVTLIASDSWGNSATGYTGTQVLTFSGPANSPNGTAPLYPSSVLFNSSGVGTASITLYDAQTTTITATQGPISGTSASFTVTGTGTATAFALSTPSTQTAGTAFNETVTAIDTYGNTATSYAGSKSVTFTGPANAPNGQAPAYPGTVSFTNGAGTASITLYDAQSTTLTATQGSLTGTSGSFTVSGASSADHFTVPTPSTQTAGTAFNEQLTAIDTWGNTATGYTGAKVVTFSGPANAPNGTAPTYPGSVSFAGGVGTASIKLYDAQSTTLTATQGSATGTSGSFTVNPAGASAFNVANPGTQTAGTAFSVTINALDAWGNAAPSYTGTQVLTFSGPANSPGGQAPAYPASVSFTSGVGTANVTLYNAASTTLTATQGSLTDSSPPTFTVNAAGANSFKVPTPSTQTAGTAFNETVTAIDTYGNTATSYAGSKSVTFTGPANAPNGQAPAYPGTVSFTNGAGTASITLYDAQSTTLTATQGSLTGTSGSFTVSGASSADHFTVPTPSTQTAGTAFNEQLTAIDTWGNTATGYTGAKVVTFSGPANAPNGTAPTYPGSVSFAGGVGTASIKLYDAQSTTLTATQGSATGTSGSFTVNPAGASAFNVANPGTQTAGTAFSVTITALDAWGNTAPSYTGTQVLTFSGPANAPGGQAPAYPASVSFSSGVGTANVTLYNAPAPRSRPPRARSRTRLRRPSPSTRPEPTRSRCPPPRPRPPAPPSTRP